MQEHETEQVKVGRVELVIMVKLWFPMCFAAGESEHKTGLPKHPF